MADRCAQYTYAGITINGAVNTDTMIVADDDSDGIVGLDGAPVRRQVDPLAGVNGGDSQPAFLGFRVITFSLTVFIGTYTGVVGSVYNTKLMTLQKAVISAFESNLNSASALAWTDATGDSQSINCMYGMPGGEVQFSGPLFQTKCTFSLLAENPSIS